MRAERINLLIVNMFGIWWLNFIEKSSTLRIVAQRVRKATAPVGSVSNFSDVRRGGKANERTAI